MVSFLAVRELEVNILKLGDAMRRLALLACARKCGPTGSMFRCVADESSPTALKSFSPNQPEGRTGKGNETCTAAIVKETKIYGQGAKRTRLLNDNFSKLLSR